MLTKIRFVFVVAGLLTCVWSARAQSTEFTYQGRLLSGDVPASGSYDFEFALFDADTGGNQLGSTFSLSAVNVNNGVFSVRIDFGNQFPGASRFLEIHVKEAGSATFAVLSPRQAISSAPYSIKSLNATNADSATNATNANTAVNATQLGGVGASQYVLTTDARLTNQRPPTANSINYIWNGTTQQAGSSFNITGNGLIGGSVGIGTTNPITKLYVAGGPISTDSLFGFQIRDTANPANTPFAMLNFFNSGTDLGLSNFRAAGIIFATNTTTGSATARMYVNNAGNVGINNMTPQDKLDVGGIVRVRTLGAAGSSTLCLNVSSQISSCSSSIRYKTDVRHFGSGLDLIRKLRPVSFTWKDGGMRDFGLVAEEVNKVEPLLTTTNDKGEVEGVKYDRVSVVLVNAINEQQKQIENQQKEVDTQKSIIERQQAQIDALKKLVCSRKRVAAICRQRHN